MAAFIVSSKGNREAKTLDLDKAKEIVKFRESNGEFCQIIKVDFNDCNLIYQTN